MSDPVFLKLGGSLLTDKNVEGSFRREVAARLGGEIRSALDKRPIPLLLGHGAGSFGHYVANRFKTRSGLQGGGGWRGYSATRRSVIALNGLVLDAFAESGFYPVCAPPSAFSVASGGALASMDLEVIEQVLAFGQTPMVCGDAVIDRKQGFTICSTEDIFEFLAPRLKASRILLACDVDGIIAGDPRLPSASSRRIEVITESGVEKALNEITGSAPNDVTGGMAGKLNALMRMARATGAQEIRIFSGLIDGAVEKALLGEYPGGTVIRLK